VAFVISQGTIAKLNRPDIRSPQRIAVSPFVAMDYLQLWKTQPSVRRAVTFLARNVAQLGLGFFERRGDDDRRKLSNHPLSVLLQAPNPWTTQYRFLNRLMHDLGIFDTSYWVKAKDNQLIHLPAPLVTPKGDNWLTPEVFEFRGQKGVMEFARDRVLYFRGYDGMSDAGVSPIESLRRTLREEWTAGEMREQVMQNGARMSGYLQRPSEAPEWSTDARKRFKASWQAQYAGSIGTGAGGTPILEDGMTFVAASQTAEQLQYIEGRKLTDEEVARTYFIPPPMLGLLEKATFSNITEQRKMLYTETLGPWLKMIEDEIDLQLIPDFEPTNPKQFYCEFNLREKLSGSFEERADSMQKAIGAPYMTVNEGRSLDNLPPIDGGDDLVRPLNVTQNGDQQPIPAASEEKPNADEANHGT
jgi:HK97 family phage portal protein